MPNNTPHTTINDILYQVSETWERGGLIIKLFRRRRQVKILLKKLPMDTMPNANLFKAVAANSRIGADVGLLRLILSKEEVTLLDVMRQCQTGITVPAVVWNRIRKIHAFFIHDKSIPYSISLLLEATAFLVTSEESRIEAYIKDEGEVVCWKLCAYQALLHSEKAKLILEQIPISQGIEELIKVCATIRSRAEAISNLDESQARKDPRYQHLQYDPPSAPGPVFIPYAYEPAFSDKKLMNPKQGGKFLAEAMISLGFNEAIKTWLAASDDSPKR